MLRFCDSFDHYTTDAQALTKWTTTGGDPPSAGNGRNATASIREISNGFHRKQLDAQTTWILGVAYKHVSSGTDVTILELLDSGTNQLQLRMSTATGLLSIYRAGVLLGTGTIVLSTGVYYYIELKATIHNTTGTVVVRVNGVVDINLSGQDTQNTANASANQVQVGGNGTSTEDFDDFYACDATGTVNNDFLGDVRVEALFPNGNGNSSQLVGSDADSVDNYLLVDEATPNDDTDYVESSTIGQKDTYAFTNLTPTSGAVAGVQIVPRARKTDAGVRSIASIARLSATEVDSADKTLGTTYGYLPDIRETKPGGGAWAVADVNAAEFGVKVTA